MNVNPGELTKRIAFLEPVTVLDEDGYGHKEYRTVRRCWAKLTRASGTEALKHNADFASIQLRFLVYYPPVPIHRKMAVLYQNQLYEITYINDYGDEHAYLEVWCQALTLEE